MIHNVPEPDISPDFTIEDIHKIRAWNYERLKDATKEERIEDVRKRASEGFAQIEALRASGGSKAKKIVLAISGTPAARL